MTADPSIIAQYVEAAHNKIGLARRDLQDLETLRRGDPSEREDVQRYFEGVIRNGESAGDQIAEAVASKLGLTIRNNSPRRLIAAVDARGLLDPAVSCVRAWIYQPIVIDAHKRRRDAVHHHYEKRPHRPEGTWNLEPQRIGDDPSPYNGPLDVHRYCGVYVATLALLEEAGRQLEP